MNEPKVETARIVGAGLGVTLYGLTLNEWVAAATLFYLFLQIIVLAPKAWTTIRRWVRR
jgi:hypothetical protein